MTTEAEIQEALDTVEAVVLREQEAEQRGTTRFSRLPGLYAERDRLNRQLSLAREPRDRAFALAAEISTLPNSDRLAVAARLRAAEPYLSVTAPGVQTFTRYDAEHHAPETRYVLAAEHEAAIAQQPKCWTCNGHGLVGGFVGADSGYHAEDCPDCMAEQPGTHERGQLYTCIDKGGRYELLGSSSGAGGCRLEGRVVYRCLDTGQLYHRTDEDFAGRMAPLAGGES